MIYELDTKLNFGQYKDLTVRQIYQGTLRLDKLLLRDYLNHILNSKEFSKWAFFNESQFIESFDLSGEFIWIKGEIDNPELSYNKNNLIHFGNLEDKIQKYINQHFHPNFLGILPDIRKFNNIVNEPQIIGGDPQYLKWCERKNKNFNLSKNCKNKLSNLSYAKLKGINIMYIGKEMYDYGPDFKIVNPNNSQY